MSTTDKHSPLYLIEIVGSNGSGNRTLITRDGKPLAELGCSTSGQAGGTMRVDSSTGPAIALFRSEFLAREVALASLWNGQRFRVKAARGNAKESGSIVEVLSGDVLNSRSADRAVVVGNPPHRPRRDPNAARAIRSYRLHPDTIAKIDAESKRAGESAGQVIDRLASTLPE